MQTKRFLYILFFLLLFTSQANAIFKNVAGQQVVVYAYDIAGEASKTGDAANITAYISLDNGASVAISDTNPTESDSTKQPGLYVFDLATTETNANLILISASSSTGDVWIEPISIYTREVMRGNDSSISGSAKRPANSYVLSVGTQSANTFASTEELDGIRHEHTDTGGSMDLYYEFDIGSGLASEIKITGYLQGNNDDLEVYGYDWVSDSWKQIGVMAGLNSSANVARTYDLLFNMVGSDSDEGKVRVRLTDGAFTLTSALLAIDQILVEFSQGVEGYQNAAVWLDTSASNTNTVRGVDGTATNPVSTIAAANALLVITNLNSIEVANSSSFTFATSQENQKFVGRNWTLALGGQSISGSFIEGANITGIATGATPPHFDHCHFGDVTLPPSDSESCVLQGTFTLGAAGDYFFEDCKSGVAGTVTPVLDFGSGLDASNINMRAWSGGIETRNMGAGAGSYNMSLEGWGQLVIAASCSADSTIAIRGSFTVTDNAGGAVTLSDDARFTRLEVSDVIWDEILNGSNHNITTSAGRRLRELDEQIGYQDGAIWINTTGGGASGTAIGENGTVNNPSDNITDAISLAVSIGIVRLRVSSGSSITLIADLDGYEIYNSNWDLYLGGQSISNSCVSGATVNGIATGVSPPKFIACDFSTATLPPSSLNWCSFGGTITAGSSGSFFFNNCYSSIAGPGAPTFDFGSSLNSSDFNWRAYSGGIEIENMGAGTGTYNASIEGWGQVIFNANCSATSLIEIRGLFTITDNSGGSLTVSDNARYDTLQINAQADIALVDYDGPTNTEMDAAHALLATQATLDEYLPNIPGHAGAVFYVDGTGGNDSNDGLSFSAAKLTITAGIAAASAGDMVRVAIGEYVESDIEIPAGKDGLLLIGGPGVILTGTLSTTNVLLVTAPWCLVSDFRISGTGLKGVHVTGSNNTLKNISGFSATTMFYIDANNCILIRCTAKNFTVAGFNFLRNFSMLSQCHAIDALVATGFLISGGRENILDNCHTNGNETAGFQVDAGSTDNVIVHCSSGPADGARIDNGTNTSWPDFRITEVAVSDAQILVDLTDIKGTDFTSATHSLAKIIETGNASWVNNLGDGTSSHTIEVTDAALLPIADVLIEIFTEEAMQNQVVTGRTDNFGLATFFLDPGTYYARATKSGYSFVNPQTEVVE